MLRRHLVDARACNLAADKNLARRVGARRHRKFGHAQVDGVSGDQKIVQFFGGQIGGAHGADERQRYAPVGADRCASRKFWRRKDRDLDLVAWEEAIGR